VESENDQSWSCYPQGLMPTRRAFLRTLVAAAATAGASFPSAAQAQDLSPGDELIPSFPPGGFPEGSVQLNFNENPLGPSKKAIAAILGNGLEQANRYNYIDPLVDAIARHHGMPSKNVLVGCGSTEFLQFTPWAFLKDGGNIVLPTPSYGWSGGVAETMGRKVVRVPLGRWGAVDTVAMKKAISRDTRIVYLANPNGVPRISSRRRQRVGSRAPASAGPRPTHLFKGVRNGRLATWLRDRTGFGAQYITCGVVG